MFSFIPIVVGFVTYMGMMIDFQENYNRTVEKTKALNDAAVEYIDGIEVIKAWQDREAHMPSSQRRQRKNATRISTE